MSLIFTGKMSLTYNRLALTAILLAVKYNEDCYFDNKYYAKIGGISLKELNYLERIMLGLMNYELYVSGEEYEMYLNEIYKNSIKDESVCMEEIEDNYEIRTIPSMSQII